AEARRFQPLRQIVRVARVAVLPHELVQRCAGVAQCEDALRVRDRRLDLAAVADDACVAEQPLDVALAEARDLLRNEVRERRAERLALAQDRDPREAGLEALEAEALVQAALVAHGAAP